MTLHTFALIKGALVAAVAGASLVAASTVSTASTTSANVVCNRSGECWRARDNLAYPAGIGITFHSDAWGYAHRAGGWRWRADRVDRGGYRGAVWMMS